MPVTSYSFKGLSLDDVLVDMAVRFILNCPEEDLTAMERFFFQVEEAHWFYEDFARVSHPALPHFRIKQFVERLFQAVPLLKKYIDNPIAALSRFKSYKSLIPVRGGIILNQKMDKVLMVQPWKSKVWVFPRGKINKNETDEKCAIREVLEETGFDMSAYVKSEDYIEVTRQNKNIRLYVVSGVPETTFFETQTRKEISEIKWHQIRDLPVFSKKNDAKYQHAVPFLHGLKQYIAKAKGELSQLSTQETIALKNLLGLSDQVEADQASAQKLVSMIQGPVVPMGVSPGYAQYGASPMSASGIYQDQQVVKDLFNNSSSREDNIKSAEQILKLLQNEIATEKVMETPAKITVPSSDLSPLNPGQYASVPPVPPNSMLQSLVTSRKGNSNSGLLSVLGGERPDPTPAAPVQPEIPRNEGGLLSLLKFGASSQPATTNTMSPSGQSLMSLLKGPEPETLNASAQLVNLLQPTAGKAQPPAPAVSDKDSLMSLLKQNSSQKEEHPKESTPAASHLMDLLGTKTPTPKVTAETVNPSQSSGEAANLLGLLNPKPSTASGSPKVAKSQPEVSESTTTSTQRIIAEPPKPQGGASSSLMALLNADGDKPTASEASEASTLPAPSTGEKLNVMDLLKPTAREASEANALPTPSTGQELNVMDLLKPTAREASEATTLSASSTSEKLNVMDLLKPTAREASEATALPAPSTGEKLNVMDLLKPTAREASEANTLPAPPTGQKLNVMDLLKPQTMGSSENNGSVDVTSPTPPAPSATTASDELMSLLHPAANPAANNTAPSTSLATKVNVSSNRESSPAASSLMDLLSNSQPADRALSRQATGSDDKITSLHVQPKATRFTQFEETKSPANSETAAGSTSNGQQSLLGLLHDNGRQALSESATPGSSIPRSSTPGSSTPGSSTPGSSTPRSSTPRSRRAASREKNSQHGKADSHTLVNPTLPPLLSHFSRDTPRAQQPAFLKNSDYPLDAEIETYLQQRLGLV